MYHYRHDAPRRTPPPDGVSGRNATTGAAAAPARARSPQPHPDFLIVRLFGLRLAKRLIEGLENYAGRDADVAWLDHFLAPYPPEFGLAKTSGARKADYIEKYQEIVSRMKRQPQYPMRFMQLNPDRSMQRRQQGRDEASRESEGRMTDQERLDIIDFCDAAGEWGSTVPIPAHEADRMIELADQRRIVDLDEIRAPRDDRSRYEVEISEGALRTLDANVTQDHRRR